MMRKRRSSVGRFVLRLLGFILLLIGLNFWSSAKTVTESQIHQMQQLTPEKDFSVDGRCGAYKKN